MTSLLTRHGPEDLAAAVEEVLRAYHLTELAERDDELPVFMRSSENFGCRRGSPR